MRDKLQLYTVIADYTASHLTDSWQQWTAFLATASRLYKYSYYDQLMIFSQAGGDSLRRIFYLE